MKRLSLIISLAVVLLSSCGSAKKENEKTLIIGPETVMCNAGAGTHECLLVKYSKDQKDWEYFYNDIKGFTYEEGYVYEIVVKEEKKENVPADASTLSYTLVKQVSKKKEENAGLNTRNVVGTYEGTLPCADCPGMKKTLVLNKDNTYILTTEYEGESNSTKLNQTGNYTIENGRVHLMLDHDNEPSKYRIGAGFVEQLDMDGKKIDSEHNYKLYKK